MLSNRIGVHFSTTPNVSRAGECSAGQLKMKTHENIYLEKALRVHTAIVKLFVASLKIQLLLYSRAQ